MQHKEVLAGGSDLDLCAEYRKTQDRRCFEELFGRHRAGIRAACLRFFHGNNSMAEDAMQETFARVLEKIRQAEIENFRGWLYAIARNCCIDTHRKEHRALYERSESVLRQAKASSQDPEHETWIEQVRQRINALNDKQRVALKLYLQGFSYREISKLTRFSGKEVKSALQTAKENIRSYLLKGEKDGREYA